MENGVYVRMAVLKDQSKVLKEEKIMKLLIQNACYIASNGETKQADILIENGIITKIENQIDTLSIGKWMQLGS